MKVAILLVASIFLSNPSVHAEGKFQDTEEKRFGAQLWYANALDLSWIIYQTESVRKEGRPSDQLLKIAYEFGKFVPEGRRLKGDYIGNVLPSIQNEYPQDGLDKIFETLQITSNKLVSISSVFDNNKEGRKIRSQHSEAEIISILRKEMIVVGSMIANAYRILLPTDVERMYSSFSERAGLNEDEKNQLRKVYSLRELEAFKQGLTDVFKK